MKIFYKFFYLIALSLAILCCSGEDDLDEFSLVGTNTSIAAMAGSWNATSAIFTEAGVGQPRDYDVVAEGGTATLNIQANGRFTLTISPTGLPSETITGDLRFDEDLLVVFFDDDPEEWEYFTITHNDPNLTIGDRTATGEFDFDGDGTLESANIYLDLERI